MKNRNMKTLKTTPVSFLAACLALLALLIVAGCDSRISEDGDDEYYLFEAEDYADLSGWYIDNNIVGHSGRGYLVGIREGESDLPVNIEVPGGEYSVWAKIYSLDGRTPLFRIGDKTYGFEDKAALNRWEWKKICRCTIWEDDSFSLIMPGSNSRAIIDSFLITTDRLFDPGKEFTETGLSIEALQENYSPLMGFDPENHALWKNRLRSKLEEALGNPQSRKTDLREVTFQKMDEGTYTRQRVVFHSTDNTVVKGYLMVPKGMTGKIPAVIALPAHHTDKEVISGRMIVSVASSRKDYDTYYRQAYALDLVNKGYIVLVIDLPYYGERYVSEKDHQYAMYSQWYGSSTVMSQAVLDVIRAVDYLETREEVDNERIGIAGLSLGGNIALLASAIDERIKATIASGALTAYDARIMKKQLDEAVIPIRKYGEYSDIAMLIAPRGLFIESSGRNDPITPFNGTVNAVSALKEGYKALGMPERFGYESAGDETLHAFIGNMSFQWLNKVMDYEGIYHESKESLEKIAVYRKNTYMMLSNTSRIIYDDNSIDGQAIDIGSWLAMYDEYPPGNFLVAFRIKAEAVGSMGNDDTVALLVIKKAGYSGDKAVVKKEVKMSELEPGKYRTFRFKLRTNRMAFLEFNVLSMNKAKIIVDKIFAMPEKSD